MRGLEEYSAESAARLRDELSEIIAPSRVLTRSIDLAAFASDASCYRLIPRAVVLASSVEDIRALFSFSRMSGVSLTFRAAGTSLSGQAVTDGILVEVARFFREVEVLKDGASVRVQPGAIGGHINQALAPFGRKLGPDPASISTCTIGGILANNSSGMCCGVEHNAYHTLKSMKFLLPSGTFIDTASRSADEEFRAAEPSLTAGLVQLRQTILADSLLCSRIKSKYRRKNTTGYSLNAFVDFERPIDIFEHLLVGSEGTLAFIAEAVFRTVEDPPLKCAGLLFFSDSRAAASAVPAFSALGAKAIEIMDRSALRSVESQPTSPAILRQLVDRACALLVEFQGSERTELDDLQSSAADLASTLQGCSPATFTSVPEERAKLWKLRSGMFPSVGATRKSGTSVIIEDVAFPAECMGDAIVDLQSVFQKHGYADAIIFGHAKEGNLHFVISQSFNNQASTDQYAGLIEDVVQLVVERYDGSLKAEHGTGRNMAPFVEVEWGRAAYRIMKQLKSLVDPDNLLNPGVIINSDKKAHLRNLKSLPSIEPEVDKCIECGFCEPRCPSRDLTLTPRQRIVVRRETRRLSEARGADIALDLERQFDYAGLDTCAADGMCATACPVQIDTGQLVKRLRNRAHSEWSHRFATLVANHFRLAETALRAALGLGHVCEGALGRKTIEKLSTKLSRVLGGFLPTWQSDMPYPATRPVSYVSIGRSAAVYLPSCLSRVMGQTPGREQLPAIQDVFFDLADRAGIAVFIPEDAAGSCCGTPFGSKGFQRAQETILNRTIERLWCWSDAGRIPIVIDTSPCAYGLVMSRQYLSIANKSKLDAMEIVDAVQYVHDTLLPRLKITNTLEIATLHPVCSLRKLGLQGKLEGIVKACSRQVHVPSNPECCGFAGDRGFLFPELTASATRDEAREVKKLECDAYVSSSRTCEVAMSRATGRPYGSYLYLLHRATNPRFAKGSGAHKG